MWAPHLNLALCSSAYTHPFTGNDTITIGWIAVHALVWEHAHSLATWHEVCVFIYCPLNCLMIARFYEHDLKNIVLGNNIIPSLAITWTLCMLSSRALKYCQTITKKNVLSRVLQITLSRELPSVFCTLSCTSTSHFFFWKDQKGNKKYYARCNKAHKVCIC